MMKLLRGRQSVTIVLVISFVVTMYGTHNAIAQEAPEGDASNSVEPSPKQRQVELLKQQIGELEIEASGYENERKVYEQQLVDLDEEWRASISKQDALGISVESFPEIVRILQSQKIEMLVDLAGLEARQTEIQKSKEAELNDASLVSRNFEKIVAHLKNELETLKAIPNKDSETLTKIEKAEAFYAEGQKIMSEQTTQTDSISGLLKDELFKVALDQAEKKARLKIVDELLTKSLTVRDDVISMNKSQGRRAYLELRINSLVQKNTDISTQIAKLKTELSDVEKREDY